MGETNSGTGSGPSSVTIENKSIGVEMTDRAFLCEIAKSIMATSPLIELDDSGNLKQVSEAKAKKIAKQCVQYAKILAKELDKK